MQRTSPALRLAPSNLARGEYRSLVFSICLRVNHLAVSVAPRQAAFFGGKLQSFLAVELGLADELFDAVGQALGGIRLCTRIGGSFGADQKRDFAAGGPFLKGNGQFGKFAAAKLFVQLRNFARDAGAAITENFARVGNTSRDPLRSLVKDDGAVFDA